MSIISVMQAVETVIKKNSNYDRDNVTIGDWTPLEQGNDRVVILEYNPSEHGPGTGPPATHTRYGSRHNVIVNIYRRYTYDGTTYENLLTDAGSVMSTINNYSKLDSASGVMKAVIRDSSDVFALGIAEEETPVYLRIYFTLEVIEEVTP